MTKIPPLPKADHSGRCPWCSASIIGSYYDSIDEFEDDLNEIEELDRCPSCDKPIDIVDEVRVTITVKAARTEKDKQYMEMMGIKA